MNLVINQTWNGECTLIKKDHDVQSKKIAKQGYHYTAREMGTSWLSMINKLSNNNIGYDYPARLVNPRGSAIGSKHSVEWKAQYEQLFYHAEWPDKTNCG